MKKFFMFCFLFFAFCFRVYASHLDLYKIDGVYSSQFNMDNGSYFSSNQKKYVMDGRVVYCVEPGINIMTREYDSTFSLFDSGFSSDVLNSIGLIGYFGYDYPGHSTDNYFLATQELIWETIGNNEVHFTTGINNTGSLVDIESEKNEIMSLINNYNVKPSFDSDVVTGVYNEEIVLVDTNNVLSDYIVVSSNNNVRIDGNKLIINLNFLGNDKITLIRKKYDDLDGLFYFANDSQDFMFLRPYDVTSYIDVNSFIPYSNILISKTAPVLNDIGPDNSFVYVDEGIDGVVFDLYAAGDILIGNDVFYVGDQFIQSIQIDDGIGQSIDLPNGDYYLKERFTLDEYVLNDDIFHVRLDNTSVEVYTHMIDIHNDRKRIFLNLVKHGESFEIGSDTVPLEGVEFGLYSSTDIYNNHGSLLINKDMLIRSFVTDSSGVINELVDIPFGTYYLKELNTLPGYRLDDNVYEFSVSGNCDGDINILIGKEPIVNEVIKGSLVIKKVDEFGNGLSNVGFKLFDSKDNLVFDGFTDKDGILSINDLLYGKYYFYEYSTPFGYISDDTLYEINILEDESIVSVSVLNHSYPITSDIYFIPKKLSLVGLSFGFFSLSLGVLYDKKIKNS